MFTVFKRINEYTKLRAKQPINFQTTRPDYKNWKQSPGGTFYKAVLINFLNIIEKQQRLSLFFVQFKACSLQLYFKGLHCKDFHRKTRNFWEQLYYRTRERLLLKILWLQCKARWWAVFIRLRYLPKHSQLSWGVLQNYAKFPGKHKWRSLLSVTLQACRFALHPRKTFQRGSHRISGAESIWNSLTFCE